MTHSELVLGGSGSEAESLLCGSALGFWNESQWEAPGRDGEWFTALPMNSVLWG